MKHMMKMIFAAVSLSLFSAGCGTIRLNYSATAKDQVGNLQTVSVEKSYPVEGGIKSLCYLTAIGFGGACWYYLVMPTTTQKRTFAAEVPEIIRRNTNVDLTDFSKERIKKASWEDEAALVQVIPYRD